MKKMGKIIIILIFGAFFVFPAAAQMEWNVADIQDIYMQFLRYEGYFPVRDDDGDIQFRVSGNSYYIIFDENYPQFVQIYRGIGVSGFSMEETINAANITNRSVRVVKTSISGREINGEHRIIASFSIEMLLNNPVDLLSVHQRALSLLRHAENTFTSLIADN